MKLPFPFMRRFSRKRLGIDLGTANSLVHLAGTGIVLNEPTVVAVSIDDNRVMAVGRAARDMLGRTPEHIMASRPLKDGVIADYVITEAMLHYFIDRVCGRSRVLPPDVMVCVPVGVTSVERRAVVDATHAAGARRAYLIDEPLAAAIGANVPIGEPSGNMVVDIGGGSTEIAVISLGGVVAHASVRVAGNKIDEAIASFIRREHNLLISDRMAEELKVKLGNAFMGKRGVGRPAGRVSSWQASSASALLGADPSVILASAKGTRPESQSERARLRSSRSDTQGRSDKRGRSGGQRKSVILASDEGSRPGSYQRDSGQAGVTRGSGVTRQRSNTQGRSDKRMPVRGRDTVTGLPRTVTITEAELNQSMQEPLRAMVTGVKRVLEHVPPELSSDIIDKGIIMSGGGALLRNLDRLFTEEIGVPCHVAENALMCVAIGTGMAMEGLTQYERSVRRG